MAALESEYNYLVLSDLHLSEGNLPGSGLLSRNEDFFYDDAFARFVAYHLQLSKNPRASEQFRDRPWKLVINGDIFDFLQVTSLPAEGDELELVRGVRTYQELSDNERDYGLGTRSQEIVWKLERIAAGHSVFFQALGYLVAHSDCQLVLMKGNHDVEMYWPDVQRRLRELVAREYADWHLACRRGHGLESPLLFDETLPQELPPAALENIKFPAWFYHVPDLLYIEHGSQYDPANALTDFLDPRLPQEPDQIELPSGSFFVRYFFNKIEQTHPFADNMKPIAKYVRWAVNEEPLDSIQMLIEQRTMIFKSVWDLVGKQADPIKGSPSLQRGDPTPVPIADSELPLNRFRWQQLYDLQRQFQARAAALGTRTSKMTAGMVAVSGLHLFMLAYSLRNFVREKWRELWASLVAAGSLFVGKTLLNQQLNKFDSLVTLKDVAQDVCQALNQPDSQGQSASVRYHLMGHNHNPRVEELLTEGPDSPPYRQWYINTGCWLPAFREWDRLTRGDVQLVFFRLTPGASPEDEVLPVLWEWLPQADRPRPIRVQEA